MSHVDLDYRGIGEMLCSPEMQANMHARAERIAEAARATAPVGPEKDGTHYRDSFEVSSGVEQTLGTRRAYGRVENTADYAAAIELGNYRTRQPTIEAHHVLGRALDAAKDT